MPIKGDIRGMTHAYSDYFLVGREKVREFALAIKSDAPASHDEVAAAELGHDSLVAPLTFVSVMALVVQKDFFKATDVGLETLQIVQVDQKFVYHIPIKAGDKIWCNFEVVSVKEAFGADIVVTKNTCTNDKGETVLEAFTTLMGQDWENPVKIDFM
jgi:hypothetical protein